MNRYRSFFLKSQSHDFEKRDQWTTSLCPFTCISVLEARACLHRQKLVYYAWMNDGRHRSNGNINFTLVCLLLEEEKLRLLPFWSHFLGLHVFFLATNLVGFWVADRVYICLCVYICLYIQRKGKLCGVLLILRQVWWTMLQDWLDGYDSRIAEPISAGFSDEDRAVRSCWCERLGASEDLASVFIRAKPRLLRSALGHN